VLPVLRRRHELARAPEPDRRAPQGVAPVHEPVVDERGRERDGVVHGPRRAARGRATGELSRDDGPRGVGVAPCQLEAAQARAAARLDEWADARALVVEHDREVRHVGAEPRQVPCRRDHPRRGDDGERGVGGLRVGREHGRVPEACEVAGEPLADLPRCVDGDSSWRSSGCRGIRSAVDASRCRRPCRWRGR